MNAQTSRPMRLSVCRQVVNKSKDFEILATGFVNEELTQAQLAAEINDGHAFSTQHEGRRKQENFIAAGYIGLDFDNAGIEGLDRIIDDPFVEKYRALVYHTPSSTEDNPRFRIIFQLEQPIYDPQYYRDCVQAFIWKFDAGVDQSCKDPCRFFYGSKGSNPSFTNNILPMREVAKVVAAWRQNQEEEERLKNAARRAASTASATASDARKKAYWKAVLEGHADRIRAAVKGERHDTLSDSAIAIAGYCAGEGLDEFEARRILEDAYAVHNPDKDEMRKVLDWSFEKGRDKSLYFELTDNTYSKNGSEFKTHTATDQGKQRSEEPTEKEKPEDTLKRLFWHVDELDTLPLAEWLIKPILLQNSIAFIVGDTGTLKSFQAIDWALGLAQEKPVAYIAGEGQSGYKTRVAAWKKYHKKPGGNCHFSKASLQPANLEQLPVIIAAMKELKPAFIVVDTLNRAAIGLNENDQRDMGLFIDALARLRDETGACILVVHHTNRGGAERGSSALKDGADTFIKCEKEGDLVKVSCEKQKDRKPFDEYYVGIEVIELPEYVYSDGDIADSLVIVRKDNAEVAGDTGRVMGNNLEVLKALAAEIFRETGATVKRLQEHLGGKWDTDSGKTRISRALNNLLKMQYVSQSRKGEPYTITQAGLDVVAPQPMGQPEPF